jgi:Tfp pilus assembly protein PilO
MPRERVRKIARWFEWGALALVGVDILLYVALVGPVGGLRTSEEREQRELAGRLVAEKEVVARFEQFKNAAPQTSQELMSFTDKHISPRREAYYRAARLVRELADRSGLQLTGISYKLDLWRGEPLRRLSVEIRIVGPFDGLLKFAHDLDAASQFVLLENCSLQGTEGEGMAMSLTAGMYLEP